jgi:eukaryotic-like serine/threonine-protein kinase
LVYNARARNAVVPPPIATAIISGVLFGLHAAHMARDEQGQTLEVVHRDVSPQNILVGADGLARLIDFGIARARARVQSTTTGQLKGKLAYVAPEQLRGQAATPRTDIYAAGVVLWELLSGRELFVGESEAWILEQIRLGYVDPPSKFVPEVPEVLDRAVLQALATRPRERFESAREMAMRLQLAVAPAPASEIGDWVNELCGEALRSRERRLVEIEAGELSSNGVAESVSDEAGSESSSEISGTQGDTARNHSVPVPAITRPGRRLGSWLVGALIAAAVAVGALVLHERKSPPLARLPVLQLAMSSAAAQHRQLYSARVSGPPPTVDAGPAVAAPATNLPSPMRRTAPREPRLHPESSRRIAQDAGSHSAATEPERPAAPLSSVQRSGPAQSTSGVVQEAPF